MAEAKPSAGFLRSFTVLSGAVRELWLVFGTKFLTILAYAVMNSTLILWLSVDLGYKDVPAGNLVALWSALMTLITVLVGSLVDSMGLRRAFILGAGICMVARGFMTFGEASWLALALGLFPLAVGEAFLTPVMVAAVRRYSTTAQRSISFSIFYAMMNVGFFVGNLLFDFVRSGLGEYGRFVIPLLGTELTTYRTLFLISFLLSVPNLLIFCFLLREGVEATDEGVRITPTQRAASAGAALKDALLGAAKIFSGLWRQSAFYKFLVFLTLVVAVRLIFYHMHYTYPKFGIRELGPGAPIGRLWAINPLFIIFLVPIVGALTQKVSAYRMVMIGSAISAGSVFIMALPTAWFEGLAAGAFGRILGQTWLGLSGDVHPYYVMITIFIVFLSIGEAMWSPRLYEYSAAIAPKGQEASYMSLSYLPFFLAKFFAGGLSGVLLFHYVPETGARNPQMLWLVIAATTMITPIGLLVFRRFIQVKEAGRE